MLCLQQCIDLCNLSPEEAEAIRERATLAEILAVQAECPRAKAEAKGAAVAEDALATCGMLDIRDQLLEDVWAAEDFDDLERVAQRYCDFEDTGGPAAG